MEEGLTQPRAWNTVKTRTFSVRLSGCHHYHAIHWETEARSGRQGWAWGRGQPSQPGAARTGPAGAGGRGLRGPLPAPAPLAARAPLRCRALRAKTNTSHKRPLCGTAPRPPAPPPPGQSRLCARPAAPAAQAILISVWVCAGRWKSKPPFFQRPRPDPRLLPADLQAPRTPAGSRGKWSPPGAAASSSNRAF